MLLSKQGTGVPQLPNTPETPDSLAVSCMHYVRACQKHGRTRREQKKTELRGGPIPRIRSALPLRSLISRRTPRLINASCYPPPRARLARYACVEYRRGEPRLGAGETKLDALLHKSATVRLAAISHLGKAAAPCRNSSGLLATGTTYAACCVLCQPERGVTLVR